MSKWLRKTQHDVEVGLLKAEIIRAEDSQKYWYRRAIAAEEKWGRLASAALLDRITPEMMAADQVAGG